MYEISDPYELSDVSRAYGFYRVFDKMAKRLGFRGESELWKRICVSKKRPLVDVFECLDNLTNNSKIMCNREKIPLNTPLDGYVVAVEVRISSSQDLRLSSGEVLDGLYRVRLFLRLSNPTWTPCGEPCTMFNMGNGPCIAHIIMCYDKISNEPQKDLFSRFIEMFVDGFYA